MSDPIRMKDGESLAASLLRSAADDRPSDEARARAAVALGIAAPSGAPSSTTAGSAAGGSSIAVKLVLAVVLGAGGLAAISSTRSSPIETPAAPIETHHPNAFVFEPTTQEAPPVPKINKPRPASRSLAEEVALLDRVRTALTEQDANAALKGIAEHRAHFASGALIPERDALEVEAVLASGDRQQAEALRDRFVETHGDSPLARRVKSLFAR